MLKNILQLISTLLLITTVIFLFKVYKDTEKDPFQKYFSFEEKKIFFRHVISFQNPLIKNKNYCKKYQDLIMDPKTQKLGDVFELNISSINTCSFYMIIFLVYLIFYLSFLFLTYFIGKLFPNSIIVVPFGLLFGLFSCLFSLFFITNIILFIVSIYKFYTSEINTFYEFLMCNNVNLEAFNKYRSIDNLRSDFKHFIFANMMQSIISFSISRTSSENN